jgi:hypothetical protein
MKSNTEWQCPLVAVSDAPRPAPVPVFEVISVVIMKSLVQSGKRLTARWTWSPEARGSTFEQSALLGIAVRQRKRTGTAA